MSGFHYFSSNSQTETFIDKVKKYVPNFNDLPRADNYKIDRYKEIGTKKKGIWLLIELVYPDSKNYEGHKILVYRGVTLTELKEQGSIDPHFSDPQFEYLSPIARFEPTNDGWHMAHVMIQSMILNG